MGQRLIKLDIINGNADKVNPDADLMWPFYIEIDCCSYSEFYRKLGKNCAVRHASAFGRVHALKCEMDLFLSIQQHE